MPEREPTGTSGAAPRWVAPALLLLLLAAALVVFWLPERVAERGAEEAVAPRSDGVNGPEPPAAPAVRPAPPAGPDATPWSEAQLARLRKEAQDVLEELLAIQFDLQERGVDRWAAEPFAAAAALAGEGDELYRQREYEQAAERYREGLASLQRLQESLPAEVDRQLAAVRQAIERGEPETAAAGLELATVMEPENDALAALRGRVESLPGLLELMEQAGDAEQEGDLARAERLLSDATALDPAHRRAAAERARVAEAHLQVRFNTAMSDGYTALDADRFDAARAAFRQAEALRPGAAEAASALLEAATAETAFRLAALKRQGLEYERQERWGQAVNAYEQAQQLDPTVLFAAEGLGRSRDRARLHGQFTAAIEQPERLADEQVAQSMESLLQEARRISPQGPVLSAQIARLETLLTLANKPVPVTLLSDSQTEVIVYKVARLGRFERQQLELRPGTYTAVGQRNGYRDVRREFTVSHGQEIAPVMIRCTEPI
jgi:tetratricopeptide (TPR) repeat protein